MNETPNDTPTDAPHAGADRTDEADSPMYHAVDLFASDIWELVDAARRKGYPHEVKKNGRRVM